MKRKNLPLFLLLGGFVLIVLTPFILTQCSTGIDFTSEATNNIGGTIGGTTAPIIGVVSIFLIYFTYHEQRQSSIFQEQKRNFDILYQHLNDTLDRFYNLEYKSIGIIGHKWKEDNLEPITVESEIYKGKMALNYFHFDFIEQSTDFQNQIKNKFETVLGKTYLNELLEIINSLNLISVKLHEYEMRPREFELLESKLKAFYMHNLESKLSCILLKINEIESGSLQRIRLGFIKEQINDLKISITNLKTAIE